MPLSLQVAHPNGTVLQVTSVQSGDMDTSVGVRVINGRDKDVDLNRFNNNRAAICSSTRVSSTSRRRRPIQVYRRGADIREKLVFLGRLQDVNSAILVLNENSSTDNEHRHTRPASICR